jgi:type III restriction enzyme
MLKEIKDLQKSAVKNLLYKVSKQYEVTFKSPTGSGKTFMMADFMNEILINSDIVFIVSTLSKAGLGKQNYEKFLDYNKFLFNLNPYLINSESSSEEKLYIPLEYNVYVLPRDLYKDSAKIKNSGALFNFLFELKLRGKLIYLIRDESHVATNNLDELNDQFHKIINISATPKFQPDVEISNEQAINAKLIKRIAENCEKNQKNNDIFCINDSDDVEDAIEKFQEIKEKYINKLKVNPCLIIQISNKDKAEEEWYKIKKILNDPSKNIKWMYIVDENNGKGSETNDDIGKLPVSKWKEYVKNNESLIDVIIFKMVITEGWDIPRACMLYQIRDSKSKQMDEQVIGRVRRNPILLEWEKYDEEAHELALTCWIWGIIDGNLRKFKKVRVKNNLEINIITTKLKDIYKNEDFDFKNFVSKFDKKSNVTSIFELHKKWNNISESTSLVCWEEIKNYSDWIQISNLVEEIEKENNKYLSDYKTSLIISEKENFNESSYFELTNIMTEIDDWIWELSDKTDNEYHFDSLAEKDFAKILKKLKTSSWGKNFYPNSKINFEYVLYNKHSSYPDFILKDKNSKIHIFEVKSVNVGYNSIIDEKEYNIKINALKELFLYASLKTSQYFYIPIKKDDNWIIFKYDMGREDILNQDSFVDYLSKLV